MTQSMIKLSHVYKEYSLDGGVFTAVSDASFTIKNKEFTIIIGPSGSGKSTLMHLIGLLDTPTRGTIEIDGKDISRFSDNDISHLRSEFVGFVFQQFNLIPKLTVLENVMLPTIYTKKEPPESERKHALELIERFGLTAKLNSFPNKLSGGQQQRVAIARALINRPKLILADEPTGNLDTKTGQSILDILKELQRTDGVTVVIVTHDEHIAKLARRRIRMVDGRIEK